MLESAYSLSAPLGQSAQAEGTAAPPSAAAVGHLRWGSFADRWEVAKQVPQMGESAITELMAVLKDDALSWEARWFAARSLGYFDQPMAITALIEALAMADEASDEALQESIIEALSQIGPGAVAALSTLLTHPVHQTAALEALTRIPHPATQLPLIAAVDYTEGAVKAKVIEALGQFADPDLCILFTEALHDRASTVRLAALQSLIVIRRQVDEPDWVTWIQPLVYDINPTVAQKAIQALGRTTSAAATETLQTLLTAHHTPETLQLATVQALAWQETAAALEAIAQNWDTLTTAARVAALQAFSRSRSPMLHDHLSRLVPQWLGELPPTAEHSLLRRHLVLLLGAVGDRQSLPILQALSHDADPGVRLHAVAALNWG
ncbi:MAG: HEAT repeat domain-containing protein [Leptolyngbya sp.]|nr:HEAT repeat domain-containing protein [Leptolyngbya sp.]